MLFFEVVECIGNNLTLGTLDFLLYNFQKRMYSTHTPRFFKENIIFLRLHET